MVRRPSATQSPSPPPPPPHLHPHARCACPGLWTLLFLLTVLFVGLISLAQAEENVNNNNNNVNATDLPPWIQPPSSSPSPQPKPPRPHCPTLFAWVPDPSDCRLFWRCSWGTALLMPECPWGTVFSRRFLVCVHAGSFFDDCSPEARHNYTTTTTTATSTTATSPSSSSPAPTTTTSTNPTTTSSSSNTTPFIVDEDTVFEFCARNPFGMSPHASECQLFFNCSRHHGLPVPRKYQYFLQECRFPFLYDARSEACRDRWDVDCEGRKMPDTECDYRNNTCATTTTTSQAPAETTSTPETSSSSSSSEPFTTTTTEQPEFDIYEVCARNRSALLAHGAECQVFYDCSDPYPVVPATLEQYLHECPYPLLYDRRFQGCRDGSRVDCHGTRVPATRCDYRVNDCQSTAEPTPSPTQPPEPPTTTTTAEPWQPDFDIYEVCARNRSALLAHGAECQVFYNCSDPYPEVPATLEQYLHECPYPLLYDSRFQECRDRSRVDCHGTRVPATRCDYRLHDCDRASPCPPCAHAVPDCAGLEDGVHGSTGGGEWSDTYVTCRGGHSVGTTRCTHDSQPDLPRLFSPLTKTCVNVYEVPTQYGGLRPDCSGRSDGRYPGETDDRSDLFTVCQKGNYVGVFRCPSDLPFFNAQTKLCNYV